jgi:hypothetical protein
MSDAHEQFTAYYESQATGRGVGGSYKSIRLQKGNGIGSFLGGLFRKVMPYIKSSASAIGNELLNTGVGLLRDHLKGTDPRASIKDRVTTASTNLGNKASAQLQTMLGLGYKRRKNTKASHSTSSSKRGRIVAPAVRKASARRVRKRDIFGY